MRTEKIGRRILQLAVLNVIILMVPLYFIVFKTQPFLSTLYTTLILLASSLFIAYHYMTTKRQVADIKQELETTRRIDSTTKVLNHRTFWEESRKIYTHAQRQGFTISCLMIYVDNFSIVNEQYGLKIGDTLLLQSAQALQLLSRETDILGSYADGEFALILPWCENDDAVKIGKRAQDLIKDIIITVNDESIRSTISVGILTLHNAGGDIDTFLNQAHRLLQDSKNDGVGTIRYEIY